MANLYEINDAILDCVDPETGEVIDYDRLDDLQMEFDQKVENIACWIKNLLSDADGIKAEKDNLAARERVCRNKAETLKKYLAAVLAGQKFQTSKVNISFRKSTAVDVYNEASIPEEYKTYEPHVSKKAIMDALKDGAEVPGAQLVENKNIQIK